MFIKITMKKIALIVLIMVGVLVTKAQITGSSIDEKIESILSQLTLEEKVALCHAQSKFSTPGVPRLGIPEIWMSDGPHGVREEIMWDAWNVAGWTNDYVTAFPALTCLASTFNPDLSGKYGFALGEESRYRKKDIILGPGVNIYRTPVNGRNFEYMGEDPYLASKMVVPYIKGVQKNGVAACVKHYVLNNQEVWRSGIDVDLSDRALHEIYLPAFKAAVQEGNVWSLMGAYNKYRGQYCCHNKVLINDILKGQWGFDGVVVTDWGATHDTKEAAYNGLDIEMGTGTDGLTTSTESAYDHYYLANPFLKMLKSGEIPVSVVDDKARRVLRLMLRTNMDRSRPFGRMNNQEHSDVAYDVAKEGVVLLKNSKSFFPLDANQKINIAVIGQNAVRPMTHGGGSSQLKTKYEISPLDGIKRKFKNATINYSIGYAAGPSAYGQVIPSKLNADSLRKAALEVASKADIVLFIGGLNKNHEQDCENGDRKEYGLPFGQETLIDDLAKVNKNIGVVLISGNAVAVPWLSKVKSLLQGWYLGSEAGNVLADIIAGDVNPSGKLPFSFPVKLSDNGAHHFGASSYPGVDLKQTYKEDVLVGYRWHDTKKVNAQFAFGYGLSYSSFKISKVKADKNLYSPKDVITLSCTVSNVGEVDGKEVVQLYVGKPKSKVIRAIKELKGFSKVFVKSKNSIKTTISIPVKDLSFYDESISDWSLEKGRYVLYVGNSSDNISKKIKITVK